MLLPPGDGGCRMLELEVIPEHGLTSEQIEFLLGKYSIMITSFSGWLTPPLTLLRIPAYAGIVKNYNS